MTYLERIQSMTVDELATLFSVLLSERDHWWLEKLQALGVDATLIECPELSIQSHVAFLEQEYLPGEEVND